jgi:hypothetical protein
MKRGLQMLEGDQGLKLLPYLGICHPYLWDNMSKLSSAFEVIKTWAGVGGVGSGVHKLL